MSTSRQPEPPPLVVLCRGLFPAGFGVLLGLSLLKLGNPVVMDERVVWPGIFWEWLLSPWPLVIGQVLLAFTVLLGAVVSRRPAGIPIWLILAPLPWFAWQCVAATGSADPELTRRTLVHFACNVACFYLGLLVLGARRTPRRFWAGLMGGFVLVLLSGWQQRFGGLEASRTFFFSEIYPTLNGDVPEALLRRMRSDRIFATLFYPNTLAGVVLLLAPVSLAAFPMLFPRRASAGRIGLMLTLILSGGCLFWSGSKAGWLILLGLALVALFRLPLRRTVQVGVAMGVLVAGLAGFAWKYSDYFAKGATSAAARLDYWEAAARITMEHPWRGTGPGTFGTAYEQIKRPESEMAHLTHNDYLQQASDSGWPGFLFFTGFIVASMLWVGRRAWRGADAGRFWIWLGLLGVAAQGLTEFGFYIPAIAWPTMALLGWLIGSTRNDLDNETTRPVTSSRA